jgi:hypothetical protein
MLEEELLGVLQRYMSGLGPEAQATILHRTIDLFKKVGSPEIHPKEQLLNGNPNAQQTMHFPQPTPEPSAQSGSVPSAEPAAVTSIQPVTNVTLEITDSFLQGCESCYWSSFRLTH